MTPCQRQSPEELLPVGLDRDFLQTVVKAALKMRGRKDSGLGSCYIQLQPLTGDRKRIHDYFSSLFVFLFLFCPIIYYLLLFDFDSM